MLNQNFIGAFGIALMDLIGANIADAISNATGHWVNLDEWAAALRADANRAINNSLTTAAGINGGDDDPGKVSTTMSGMRDTDKANASAIAALTANNNGSSTGGVAYGDNFDLDTSGSGNLGANWTQFAAGTVPMLVATGGQARLVSGSGSGRRLALYNAMTTATDDQSVLGVLGTKNDADSHDLTLICRASSNADKFVYANLYSGVAYMGYATYSGGTLTFHDWISVPLSGINTGMTFELRAVGQTYKTLVTGITIMSYTDASVAHPVDASHRYTGFGKPIGSYDLDSFNASDLSSPPVIGTGWNIYRAATGTVTQPTSSGQQVASGTYDTSVSNNVTIENGTDLGKGVVKCTKAGWYSISMRMSCTTTPGSNSMIGLLYTGANKLGMSVAQRGDEIVGNSGAMMGQFIQYVPEGWYVGPGHMFAGNTNVQGYPDGSLTYFNGALVSGAGQ